jgi:hypothetical protein
MVLKIIITSSIFPVIASCASTTSTLSEDGNSVLTIAQVNDLIDNPIKWDGRTFLINIYPVDLQYSRGSFEVCFDKECQLEKGFAPTSILYAKDNRYKGFQGDVSETIKATFDAGCFTDRRMCVDLRNFHFYETE